MKEIDFLPRSFHDALRKRMSTRRNVLLSLGLVLGLGMLHVATTSRLKSAEASLAAIRNGDLRRLTQHAEIIDLQGRKQAIEKKATLVSQLDDDAPLDAIIGEITHLMSDSMAMRAINVETATPQAAKDASPDKKEPDPLFERGKTEVLLRAVAKSDVEVGIFFGKLTACPLFDDVRLVRSDQTEQSGRQMREFELRLAVKRVRLDETKH